LSSFAELNLPESVARALADRKYENAMPVQVAVLETRCLGRDLLVSSQTGSGKTIAFGVAIAQTLLADGAAKFVRKPQPSALVIVPTRELAAQVREELGWLLRHTGMRLASFTGGTSVGGDLGALKHGVDVAIGTPGRLVDLVGRGRLDLAQIGILVLDEADEMLDLGFREDLETLLKAAPTERRTLLLSATLPPAIRELARKFQRDALPVDPRSESGGSSRTTAHEDIAYVAHLIAGGDRRAAVVNVLRASDAERVIVFCTTREGVGELHRALIARGFTATAISGDRAQAERDRALDQVRRGEARVLVATNVAARGLHLPDVDLIIHADLPLNAESLTHRSGRTGRAGRKGTAVLLATATDRRKAERLLATAHAKAVWAPPPSAEAIGKLAGGRLVEQLTDDAAKVSEAQAARVQDLLQHLGDKIDEAELLRRLLSRELDRLPAGEPLRPVAMPTDGGAYNGAPHDRRPRSAADFASDSVLFRVNMGANDKADPRWMLPLICRRGGVTNREVGAIRIGPRETLFEIARGAAADFARAASETDPRAPHVRIERATSEAREPYPRRAPVTRPPRSLPIPRTGARVDHAATSPERVKPEPVQPEPARVESPKPDPVKPGPARVESPKPDPVKPGPARVESSKPGPAKVDGLKRPHLKTPAPERAQPDRSFHGARSPQPRGGTTGFGGPSLPQHKRSDRPRPVGRPQPPAGPRSIHPVAEDRALPVAPHRPSPVPAHRAAPVAGDRPAFQRPRSQQGDAPGFRARVPAKIEIAHKVHPPSRMRPKPHLDATPKRK
jgi:ATP-dependent RNA helicase DeaD